MRPILIALMIAGLLLLAPIAIADRDGGKARPAGAREGHDDDRDDKDDDKDDDREKDARKTRSDRVNDTISRHENRTARFDAAIARLTAMRDSWAQNATRIDALCAKADYDASNSTERGELARCIHESFKDWRATQKEAFGDLHKRMHMAWRWGHWRNHH